MANLFANNSTASAASDLGLHCLPINTGSGWGGVVGWGGVGGVWIKWIKDYPCIN